MKKSLCLFLIASLLCCSFVVPSYAAQKRDITDTMEFLSLIGIENQSMDDETEMNKGVTRAEFASNALLLINESGTCDTLFYHDVSKDDWFFNAVGMMTKRGYFKGDGSGNFNPNEIISINEAVKVMISILGYDFLAQSNGGYPSGYSFMASRLDLLNGCASSGNLSFYDMYTLFENTLKANVALGYLSLNDTNNTSVYHSVDNDDITLLTICHGMYYDKGKMTACEGISIEGDKYQKDKRVTIDDYTYDTKLTDLYDYLGTDVEFVYTYENGRKDERILIWVNNTDKTDFIYSSVKSYKEFDSKSYTLSYEVEGSNKLRTAQLSRGIVVIYNNEYVGNDTDNIFDLERYEIKLISSDSDGIYDIAVINTYENYTVGVIDKYNKVIYDKEDNSKSLSLKDNKYDDITILNGDQPVEFDSINEGDVVSAFVSLSGKRIKAVISSASVSGTISYVQNADELMITVNQIEYNFYKKDYSFTNKPGDKIKLYTDMNGYVVCSELVSGDEFPAYIIAVGVVDDSHSMDGVCQLKVIDNSNTVQIYSFAKTVTVDGVPFKNVNDLERHFTDLTSGKPKQQIAIITLNSKNEIRKIDTEEPGTEDEESSLREFASYANETYVYSKIGGKILFDGNTKVFLVPTGFSTNDDDFMVVSKDYLRINGKYNAKAYRYKADDLAFEEIVVMSGNEESKPKNTDIVMLVDEVGQSVDGNGEVVDFISGYQGSLETTLLSENSGFCKEKNIKSGDVIRPVLNRHGQLSDVDIIYSYGSGRRPYTKSTGVVDYSENMTRDEAITTLTPRWRDSFRAVMVYANKTVKNTLYAGYTSGEDVDELLDVGNSTILVYDTKNSEVRVGTVGDIKTYKMLADKCSTILVNSITGVVKSLIIYE